MESENVQWLGCELGGKLLMGTVSAFEIFGNLLRRSPKAPPKVILFFFLEYRSKREICGWLRGRPLPFFGLHNISIENKKS